jgi:hypothetical protein
MSAPGPTKYEVPSGLPDVVSLASLATIPCWVAWQTEDRKKGRAADQNPVRPRRPQGAGRRSHDVGIRTEAEAMAAKLTMPYGLGGDGLGFHYLDDGRRYGGIDLDSCRDPATGILKTGRPTLWLVSIRTVKSHRHKPG